MTGGVGGLLNVWNAQLWRMERGGITPFGVTVPERLGCRGRREVRRDGGERFVWGTAPWRGTVLREHSSAVRRICQSTNLGGGWWWEHSFKRCDAGSTVWGGLWGEL